MRGRISALFVLLSLILNAQEHGPTLFPDDKLYYDPSELLLYDRLPIEREEDRLILIHYPPTVIYRDQGRLHLATHLEGEWHSVPFWDELSEDPQLKIDSIQRWDVNGLEPPELVIYYSGDLTSKGDLYAQERWVDIWDLSEAVRMLRWQRMENPYSNREKMSRDGNPNYNMIDVSLNHGNLEFWKCLETRKPNGQFEHSWLCKAVYHVESDALHKIEDDCR